MLLALAVGLGWGEWLGWPFLAVPLQRLLSRQLERSVELHDAAGTEAASDAVPGGDFRIRFIGGLRMRASHLQIAAPAWSRAPHLLRARGVELDLRYADLWRAYRGQRLRIERLQAGTLDVELERLADARASWQFRKAAAYGPVQPLRLPDWGGLQLGRGLVQYRDAPLAIDVRAQWSWQGVAGSSPATPDQRLHIDITGLVRKLPVKIDAVASGVLPWAAGEVASKPVPLSVQGSVGRAQFSFAGTATDATRLSGLVGRYSLKGPSLAAVGDVIGLTLPTTAAFRMDGLLNVQGDTWLTVIKDARVGASALKGSFVYEAARKPPLLSGRLAGTRLMLVDLGPVLGTTAVVPAQATGTGLEIKPRKAPGKVLPNRPFDLPSLRAMDANVLIDIANVDLNTAYLEPLQPLRGHLQLTDAVLRLRDLEARTAQGRLEGELELDGRSALALWNSNLRWRGVRLEHWVQQDRSHGAPPYVSGQLSGQATLTGQGRSTAEILASLNGQVRSALSGGSISHLVIEAAGLDIAQSLGVMIKGDDALPVHCAVADLSAEQGVLRTRVMVLDTSDSTVWIDGSLSMVSEQLDLRATVSPKDKSPLALRSPLRLRGSFADPQVSLETGAIGGKLAASVLLGLLNPLAALLPLIDLGSADEAGRGAAGCRGLLQRQPPRSASARPAQR